VVQVDAAGRAALAQAIKSSDLAVPETRNLRTNSKPYHVGHLDVRDDDVGHRFKEPLESLGTRSPS